MVHRDKSLRLLIVWLTILSISLFACDINLALQAKPTPVSAAISFEVFAKRNWQDTGVKVMPGKALTILYLSGLWSPWGGGRYDAIGSGGDPKCGCNVIMGVSHAALIGKIGDNDPFLVGNSFKQTMGEAGDLFLGINDTQLGDNSGSLKVEIILGP
jgi:hypothetical protein